MLTKRSTMADARPLERQHKAELRGNVPDFLVVILDLNPFAWLKNSSLSDASAVFDAIKAALTTTVVFLNAHTAMHHGNGLAVYGASTGTS